MAPGLPGLGELVTLSSEASHHLLRVTGIAPGEAVLLFDGQGQQAPAVLVGAQAGRATLRQTAAAQAVALPEVHLLIGVCKHAAMDTIVRMATELGARRIQPVLASRSVARGDRSARWQRIAESSAAQCGRAELPEVGPTLSLQAAMDTVPADADRRVLVPGAPSGGLWSPPSAILVGPEGGLTQAEVELALSAGFQGEGLGRLVLRADTAVAAALARLL